LAELLRHKDSGVQDVNSYALSQMGAAAVPALSELARDKDAFLRVAAAEILKQIGPDAITAVPALTEMLRDKEDKVRSSAAAALGGIGPAAIPALTKMLHDQDQQIREGAATALGQAKAKAAIPALTELLRREDGPHRATAAEALVKMGPNITVIVALLDDKDSKVRAVGAIALWDRAPEAKAAIPRLTELLKDKDAYVRRVSAFALAKMDLTGHKATITALTELLPDKDGMVRRAATEALAHVDPKAMGPMGPEAKAAVPVLVEILRHGDLLNRGAAVKTLRNMGPEAKTAIPALIGLLNDKDDEIGMTAVEALLEIPQATKDLSVVTGILQSPNVWTYPARVAVAEQLWTMDPKAKPIIPTLKRLLQDKNWSVRLPSALALAKLGPDEQKTALAVLVEWLRDKDAVVRQQAAFALGEIGPEAKAAIPSLATGLQDGNAEVRKAAAKALEKIKNEKK
jgi:HEAT repeat protein